MTTSATSAEIVDALVAQNGDAIISPCGLYRMRLDRVIANTGPTVALIGVNPSTADATTNDATIRKDIGFAHRHGWGRIVKANKFAWRATDVRQLAACNDPVGPENDDYLAQILAECDIAVACWGPLTKLPKRLRGRYLDVLRLARHARRDLHCFGTARDGQPRHTLMIPYTTPLELWRAA